MGIGSTLMLDGCHRHVFYAAAIEVTPQGRLARALTKEKDYCLSQGGRSLFEPASHA